MRAFPLLLLILVASLALGALAPAANAHIDHVRPSIQASEPARRVTTTLAPPTATFELLVTNEPLRQLVRHEIDARGFALASTHRPDASSAAEEASFTWQLTRLVEYRDSNADGEFQPASEALARSWRFGAQEWRVSAVRNVSVGGQPAQAVAWESATGPSGPNFTIEIAAAGRAFVDEGARVRSQDIIAYLDVTDLPPRATGHLYALEGRLVAAPGTTATRDTASNVTVGVYADQMDRRAFFVWGGEAFLDGREQTLAASLDEPQEVAGNWTYALRIHLPAFQDGRFVLVSAIEYPLPKGREPIPAPPGVAVALAFVAAAMLARRGLRPSR